MNVQLTCVLEIILSRVIGNTQKSIIDSRCPTNLGGYIYFAFHDKKKKKNLNKINTI